MPGNKTIYADFVVHRFTWEEIEALAPLAAFIHDCVQASWVPRFCEIIEFMMALARTQHIKDAPGDIATGHRPPDNTLGVNIIPVAADGIILDFALEVFEEFKQGAPSRQYADRQRELIVTLFDWYKATALAISAQAAEGGLAVTKE